ncbi:MAG TPA: redoxin domain-containing protein [Saprospiraceae bacterium]|nr:redoxin domain-containing protein [Saprospiraceae bacterium]
MRLLLFVSLLFSLSIPSLKGSSPDNGYRIEVELEHFEGDTLLLGYYFGKAQYLKDTAVINDGKFIFEGSDELKPGVYLLVIPPDNKFVHVLVAPGQTKFSAIVDMDNIVGSAKFKGSAENEIYYNYLRELEKRRPQADTLRKQITQDSLHKSDYQKELDKLDSEVKKVQDNIIAKYPSSITSMLINANREVETPDFPGLSEDERKKKQFEFYRAHNFDNFDLGDQRAMRSGLIHSKIDFFLQKLTYQYPDSQSVAMDYLLRKMGNESEAFQYYLVHFLNESARSKKMGMDAVYVHLIDNYYSKGLATWTEKEQLDKLLTQAETARPLLIGKIAPDLVFYKENGEPVSIHSINTDYTVLFFWDPECGHCKKSIPFVVDFYNEYKNKGVELLAICTKTGQDISSCWSAIKERGMDIWVNAADQYIRNRYKTIYDVKTTPQIFILDKDKKILVKKIAGEDLKTVMDEILKSEEAKRQP